MIDNMFPSSKILNIFTYQNFVHAFSGATGSSIAITAFFPFETARTRKQVIDDEKFQTTFGMLQEILQREGLSGWYQGVLSMISSVWCSNFIYFYIFNGLKSFCYSETNEPTIPMDLFLAIIAAIINVIVTSPLWVANTRIKIQGIKLRNLEKIHPQTGQFYSGIYDALTKICKTEGLHVLWNGIGPSLLLSSNPAIQFAVYEFFKRSLQVVCKTKNLSGYVYFFIGALAKMFATVSTYPLQVIQSRLRVGLERDKTTFEILKSFLQRIVTHGISSAFCGLEAKLLQTVLTSALMFLIYEKLSFFIFTLFQISPTSAHKQH